MWRDLHTFGERLRWAFMRRPAVGRRKGLRLFQRDMKRLSAELVGKGEPGLLGVSLPSISSYLKPACGITPTYEFMRAAAKACGVREAWLISNEGAPTQEIAVAAGMSAFAQPGGGDWQRERALRLKHAILEALGVRKPVPPPEHWLSPEEGGVEIPKRAPEPEPVPHWVAPLGEVWLRLHFREMLLTEPVALLTAASAGDDSGQRDAERMVGKALRGPLDALGVSAEQMQGEALGDYLSAMVPALFALAAERSRQRARLLAPGWREEEEEREEAPPVAPKGKPAPRPRAKVRKPAPRKRRK